MATAADLSFVLDLARKHAEQVGFIPAQGMANYVDRHAIDLAMENQDPAGYLLAKHKCPDLPGVTQIHQAAVCYDARRRAIGLELVKSTRRRSAAAGNGLMQLWCRGDLEANAFWLAAGFTPTGLRAGGTARNVPHVLWRMQIKRGADLDAPCSTRRRGRAGTGVIVPHVATPAAILHAINAGKLVELYSDVLRHAGEPPREASRIIIAEADRASAGHVRQIVSTHRTPPPRIAA